jgi:hypothetical protein
VSGDEHETVNRESHPNAGGPQGLAGDMGLSSERTEGFEGVEGTGSSASAQGHTDGEAAPVTAGETPDADPADAGEVRPDPVAHKHEFDPSRNPGH